MLIIISDLVRAQSFENTYEGWWANTKWTFEFKKDGKYKRVSSGHYGNTIVKGKYRINKDTIQILTGFENSHGTINEKYLIAKDSAIIDLNLYYDYKLKTLNENFYNSKKRNEIIIKSKKD